MKSYALPWSALDIASAVIPKSAMAKPSAGAVVYSDATQNSAKAQTKTASRSAARSQLPRRLAMRTASALPLHQPGKRLLARAGSQRLVGDLDP